MKNYQQLARTLDAIENCRKRGNAEWLEKHEETIKRIMQTAPSGSGIDSGTSLEREDSHGNKLVFTFGFHHMNDGGYYDGWTDHTLKVTPHLYFDIDLKISGRNRNDIKEYLHDIYHSWLTEECLIQ